MNDVILFAHPIFGMLGVLASVWVFVEALNASEANRSRIRIAAFVVAGCIVAPWALGGYWYMVFYASEKAIILKGPWPWAHNFVMETKEHLFFIPLILALYLPIAAAANLARNGGARAVVMVVCRLHRPQWPGDRRRRGGDQLRGQDRLRPRRRHRGRMMSVTPASDAGATATDELKGPAAGFGLAAAIAILFNTLLVWEPLNAYLASLAGDFWRTLGVAAVVVFFAPRLSLHLPQIPHRRLSPCGPAGGGLGRRRRRPRAVVRAGLSAARATLSAPDRRRARPRRRRRR